MTTTDIFHYNGEELEKELEMCESRIKHFIEKKYYFRCNRDNNYIVLISYINENATGVCIASRCKQKTDREIWIDYLYSECKGHGTLLMNEMESHVKSNFMTNLVRPNMYIIPVKKYIGYYESLGFVEIITSENDRITMCKSLVANDLLCNEKIKDYEICNRIYNGYITNRERFIKPYFKPELTNLLINNWKDIPNLSKYLHALLYVEGTDDSELKRQRLREIMTVHLEPDELDKIIDDFKAC